MKMREKIIVLESAKSMISALGLSISDAKLREATDFLTTVLNEHTKQSKRGPVVKININALAVAGKFADYIGEVGLQEAFFWGMFLGGGLRTTESEATKFAKERGVTVIARTGAALPHLVGRSRAKGAAEPGETLLKKEDEERINQWLKQLAPKKRPNQNSD